LPIFPTQGGEEGCPKKLLRQICEQKKTKCGDSGFCAWANYKLWDSIKSKGAGRMVAVMRANCHGQAPGAGLLMGWSTI
jgi:hypothetical protein